MMDEWTDGHMDMNTEAEGLEAFESTVTMDVKACKT